MKYIIKIAAFFLCIVTAPISANEKKTEEFLTLIGAKKQVELYPHLLSMYIQFNPNIAVALNNEAVQEKVSAIVENKIFNMDYFTYVVKRFSRIYNKERIASYQEWAQSDLGKRITQIEMDASSVESSFMILTYSETLKENPPEEKRVELIERIAAITGSSEEARVTIKSIGEGIYSGLKEAVKKDIYIRAPHKGDIPQGLDEILITTFLYTYRDVSDKDLAAYIIVLEDEDTQWLLTSLRGIYKEMITEVCEQIGQEIWPYFEQAAAKYLTKIDGFIYKSYTIDSGGFTVAFPKKPQKEVQTIPSEAGDIELTMYHAVYEELGASFFASFNVYPDTVIEKRYPYVVLDNSVAGMAGEGKTLISKEKTSIAGNPGYDVRISVLNGMMLMRNTIYLVGNKLIQIMFYGPAYIADHSKLDSFFKAFQLID